MRPGDQIERLTVLEPPFRVGRYLRVKVRCTCGTEKVVYKQALMCGDVKSCGCLHAEMSGARVVAMNTTHGMRHHRLYAVWRTMRARCSDPNAVSYDRYGALGIFVCARWEKFENFIADMGLPPDDGQRWTIERKDNFVGYEPNNCRWATYKEQAANRRPK